MAITSLGAAAGQVAEDLATVFGLITAVGARPGLASFSAGSGGASNAWAGLAAMVAGFPVGLATSVISGLSRADFGLRVMAASAVTMAVWGPVCC